MAAMAEEAKLCVVTGGRGFAARHLVEMLLRSGDWAVRVADLAPALRLDPAEEGGVLGDAVRSGRAQYASADLRNKDQVVQAFRGAEAVFHMAAPDSSINNHQLHYSVNVEGTKNVIAACKDCKVKRLIYTSSPSVVFDGVHGIYNADESMPYPEKHNDSYSATKAEAEALVIEANGSDGLLTCCIRPSSIFGPGDKLLVPSLVAAARAGKSKFIIGDGNNEYDFTYVENVAHGHVCAEKALASRSDGAAGQAFFITNMEPIKFWEFMSLILEGLGYERPKIKVPATVVMPIAHLVEWVYKALSRYGMPVPQLTPSRIRLLSCNRTFSCSKAKEKLGYMPIVPLEVGIKRTVDSYSNLRREMHIPKNTGPSKASRFLGNGKLADTLLWRDSRQTVRTLIILVAFYYYFFASGYTFVTAMSKILMLASLFLFIHGILPANILGYRIEKLSPSSFQFSVEKMRYICCIIGSAWNFIAGSLSSLCKGNNWSLFLKVVISLSAVSFLAKVDLHTAFLLGTSFLFLVFYVYDRKEKEIDGLLREAYTFVSQKRENFSRNFSTVNQAAPKN